MSTNVSNFDGHFVALLNVTKIANIGNDKKTDSAIAIALHQQGYTTISELLEADSKNLLSDIA